MSSRKLTEKEMTNWFRNIYDDFKLNSKGYVHILAYIEGEYNGNQKWWARIARHAGLGLMVIERKGVFYVSEKKVKE